MSKRTILSLRTTLWSCVLLYGLAIAGASCKQVGSEGLTVGASCSNDFDCNYRCVRGEDYPGGMCTMDCTSSNECPSDTSCIDDEGGICAIECNTDGDCADHGDEWGCVAVDQLGGGGDVKVCRRAVSEGGSGGSPEGGAGGSPEGGSAGMGEGGSGGS